MCLSPIAGLTGMVYYEENTRFKIITMSVCWI